MSEITENKSAKLQTEMGEIEANLAFFEARFALIQHQPDTAYKRAQLKAYEIMQDQLQTKLEELQLQQKLQQARKKK